jgi:hypothetical protein
MKYLKSFENDKNNTIENDLLNILNQELYTENSYENAEISNDGKECAVKKIIEYLKKLGIDLNMYSNMKKYNL